MNRKIAVMVAFVLLTAITVYARGKSGGYVKGYFRSDGTYVAPYYRGDSSPDSSFKNPPFKIRKSKSYELSDDDLSPSLPELPKIPSMRSYDENEKYSPRAYENDPNPHNNDAMIDALGKIFSLTKKKRRSRKSVTPQPYGSSGNTITGFYDNSTRVIDGDTFYWKGNRYRIQGVDTPELGQSNSYEAKDRLQQILRSGMIEVKEVAHDKYGRTVAEVTVNGQNVAETLKEDGFKKPR